MILVTGILVTGKLHVKILSADKVHETGVVAYMWKAIQNK